MHGVSRSRRGCADVKRNNKRQTQQGHGGVYILETVSGESMKQRPQQCGMSSWDSDEVNHCSDARRAVHIIM